MTDMNDTASASFAHLTPDTVLDALADVGLYGDGRLLALNSYENRVYQVGMEDGPPLVAKFYRPQRWSDTQILEEHAFVQELVEREIPVVPAMMLAGQGTLHRFAEHRFAVFPKHGGRAPELEDRATLEWMGRFIARIFMRSARCSRSRSGRRSMRSPSTTSRSRTCCRTISFRPIFAPPIAAWQARRWMACGAAMSAPARCACCGCTATAGLL